MPTKPSGTGPGKRLRPGYPDDPQLLYTFVHGLPGKLGDNARSPTYIFTEPRLGYRMASAKTERRCSVNRGSLRVWRMVMGLHHLSARLSL